MHGFVVFLGKEFTEILRTWRLYVIPGILLFIGVTSPILAEVTPGLISSMGTLEGQGVIIEIPPATTIDAYLQFSKNAMQIALLAVIIATAGAISGERRSGTGQLVLTKPLSRTSMVIAKVVSNWVLLAVTVVIAAGLCVAVTAAMFDTALIAEFVKLVAIWYLLAALMVAVTVFFSVVLRSQPGAAGAGIATFFALITLGLWTAARDYSPVGLTSAGDRLLMSAPDVSVAWPVATGIVAAILLIAATAWVFNRQEL
jgi:ABC-2 type transport system permease protein